MRRNCTMIQDDPFPKRFNNGVEVPVWIPVPDKPDLVHLNMEWVNATHELLDGEVVNRMEMLRK